MSRSRRADDPVTSRERDRDFDPFDFEREHESAEAADPRRSRSARNDAGSLSVSVLERIVDVCNEFEDMWYCGEEPQIEDYLDRAAETESEAESEAGGRERRERLSALLGVEIELRLRSGEAAEPAEYIDRFPDAVDLIRDLFEEVQDGSDRTEAGTIGGASDRRDRNQTGPERSAPPAREASAAEGGTRFDFGAGEFSASSFETGSEGGRAGWAGCDVPTLSGNPSVADAGGVGAAGGIGATFHVGEAEVCGAVGPNLVVGLNPGGAAPASPVQRALPTPTSTPAPSPTRGDGSSPRRATGRFTLIRMIDSGMFGDVYLATDDVLHRRVALKFPKLGGSASSARVETFLIEARNAAQLVHHGIVAVYDVVERQGAGDVFVVMEFIDGANLRDLLRTERFAPERAAALIAEVADAVHYAHGRGFIHRDLKPANILIDELGRPRVADFGLAVQEHALGDRPPGELAGTIPYMAPEQVRGASHRLDRRTDVWALGVILYELLTGARPFPSDRVQASDEIRYRSPPSPSEVEPSTPIELERICLKCLSKRMRDRYATAGELADELRGWLSNRAPSTHLSGWSIVGGAAGSGEHSTLSSAHVRAWSRPAGGGPDKARVVPKGLRAFSSEDAPFFLDLAPGPRDRNAVPECIRFWKTRIDATDRETAFTLGLIHGPSGSGKSSLVQAGILPRLAPHVLTVSLSTTRDGAEAELLRRIRRWCPGLPDSLGLAESIRALREGVGLPPGKKLLIVLDQFEQWLQRNPAHEDSPLVEVARQCDGARVQILIVVRNDFWTALNRFLRLLEAELSTDRSMAAVDPFDLRHARAVLAAFGRGHGALPDDPAALDDDQNEFLDRAVAELAEGGDRIVCVRLALFAEMVKNRLWTPAALDEVGGARGVGVAFLDHAIGARVQHPVLRPNQEAARAVLEALLPPPGVVIKECARSFDELLRAAKYQNRRRDFEAVLRVLDGELRLITPAEPEPEPEPEPRPGFGSDHRPESAASSDSTPAPHEPRYQLTHDYLIPSIREWVERAKRETGPGRAQVRLGVLAGLWGARPRPGRLPTFLEWLSIRRWTRPRDWTGVERAMMRAAAARMMRRGLAAALIVLVASIMLAAVVAGFGGLPLRDGAGSGRAGFTASASRPPELWRRALDGDLPPRERLVACLALLAEGAPLTPEERRALEDECRRIREREAERPEKSPAR